MVEKEEACTMIVERKELMIPLNNNGDLPSLRKAHFLEPNSNLQSTQSSLLPQHPSEYQNHPLNNKKELITITKRVSFNGMLRPLDSWKSWVLDLEQLYHEIWKKVGIFDAIKASTCQIIKDDELIIKLAEKWCPETSTFVFSWGESTITLEDVMILGGFSVLGSSAKSYFRISEGEDMKKVLVETLKNIKKRNGASHVTQSAWLKYFKGSGGEFEHVALIVLWLSRYGFASNSNGAISSNVFSIAISLTRGFRIAFAPAILAVMYRNLRLLKDKIVKCMIEGQDDGSKLVLWAPFQLLQVWAWERFPTLGPKPISLAPGEPRIARWNKAKRPKRGDLRLGIESSGNVFLWRPYALQIKNWELPKFYCDQEMWVVLNSEVDDQIMSYARCLSACELVGIDCVERYLPERVAMQFALDQDIIAANSISRLSAACNDDVAWNSYDKPLDGLEFYLPPRLCEGGVTLRYSEWWMKSEKVSGVFVNCHGNSTAYIPSCSLHSSNSRKANELGEEIEVNLQVELKGNTYGCEEIAMEEEKIIGEGSRTLKRPCAVNEPVNVSLIDSQEGLQDGREDLVSNGVGEEKEDEFTEHYVGMNEDNRVRDEGYEPVNGAEPHIGSPTNALSCDLVKNSIDDLLTISDDDEGSNGVCEAFEAQGLAIDARLNRLEKLILDLQTAKLKSKVPQAFTPTEYY